MADILDSYSFSEDFLQQVQRAAQNQFGEVSQNSEEVIAYPEDQEGNYITQDEYDDLQAQYDALSAENEALQTQIKDYRFTDNPYIQNDDFLSNMYDDDTSSVINMLLGDEIEVASADWIPKKNDKVNLKGIDSRLTQYLETLPEDKKAKLLATSGNDQTHAKGSKHYDNKALDLRYFPELHDYIKNDPLAKQYGINVADPNHGTAPHTHISINKYGGETKYPKGGKAKSKEPIITNNPKDPRLKAYQDSLNRYEGSKKSIDFYNEPYYNNIFKPFLESDYGWDPYVHNSKNKPVQTLIVTNGSQGEEAQYPIYKKPVQPVVYQKPQQNLNIKDIKTRAQQDNNNYNNTPFFYKQNKPIYTNDPKDPKLKSYNDSLNLYKETTLPLFSKYSNRDAEMQYADHLRQSSFEDRKKSSSDRVEYLKSKKNLTTDEKKDLISLQKGIIKNNYPIMLGKPEFLQPVQPVVYKKTTSPITQQKPDVMKKVDPRTVGQHNYSYTPIDPTFAQPTLETKKYQMQGQPVHYGNSMIGKLDGSDFYPDYYNEAARARVNQGESDIINDEQGLIEYLKSKGVNNPSVKKFPDGGEVPKYIKKVGDKKYLVPQNLPDTDKYDEYRDYVTNWVKRRSDKFLNFSEEEYKAQHPFLSLFGIDEQDKEKQAIEMRSKTLNNLKTLKYKDSSIVEKDVYVNSTEGEYSPYGHYIQMNLPSASTAVHETGHGSRLANFPSIKNYISEQVKNDPIYKQKPDGYYHHPDEIYSRIWTYRESLGLKPEDVVTPELLRKKTEESMLFNPDDGNLHKYLDESTIIKLMNELVSKTKNTSNVAKYGGKYKIKG